ncbi:MAG: FAD-dependent oxidoreductase [Pseudomonadota bacterium]
MKHIGKPPVADHNALVLGAGVQGCLVALMLANEGRQVTLVDHAHDMLLGASLSYEGRVHTGLLFAMDHSMDTARRLMRDACAFGPLMEHILGGAIPWARIATARPRILVHRDSHMNADALAAYWEKLEAMFLEEMQRPGAHYLGTRPDRFIWSADVPTQARRDVILAAFDSEEACLDQPLINAEIKARVKAHPGITCRFDTRVVAVKPDGDQTRVTLHPGGSLPQIHRAPIVINCLWEARALFDRQMGLDALPGESLRLKYSLLVDLDDYFERLGSVIVAHGAFGGIVVRPGSKSVFVSWYNACVDTIIPTQPLSDDWQAKCLGRIPEEEKARVLANNIAAFRDIFPNFPDAKLQAIKAGMIVAHGLRDIDKTDSGFHHRDEHPIRQAGGYFSMATGKYTSAPRNALRLQKELARTGLLA